MAESNMDQEELPIFAGGLGQLIVIVFAFSP